MKRAVAAGLSIALSAVTLAQTVPPAKKTVAPSTSHKEIRVEARNLAAEVRAPLTPAELDVARRVEVGTLPCELGQVVVIAADPAALGFFFLRLGSSSFRISPEQTSTGAIRLEDKAEGIVWLQLPNKSMLMSQKLGKRLADECASPAQKIVAQAMLKNPPPSILDAPAPVKPVKLAGD